MPADASPPADWYLDPDDPSRGRYWDGAEWSDHHTEIPPGSTLRAFDAARHRSRRRSSRPVLVAVAVGAVLVACGAVAVLVGRPSSSAVRVAGTDLLRIRGALELDQPHLLGAAVGERCAGTGAFEGVGEGTRIVVSDADGHRLATAPVAAGRVAHPSAARGPAPTGLARLLTVCRLEFTVDVPERDAYRIGVADFGDQRYSREELDGSRWQVVLGLGP